MTGTSLEVRQPSGLKRLTRMVFGRLGAWGSNTLTSLAGITGLRRRTSAEYARAVGDGLNSSVIVNPLMWVARTFPEAPLTVNDKDGTPIPLHPLVQLLRRPNPYYSGLIMWRAVVMAWHLTGEAFVLKVCNGAHRPVQLWWIPPGLIEPKREPVGEQDDRFITHYEYRPGGAKVRLENEDVIHFRYALDPDNPMRGWSPLRGVLREVFTDDEAANFTAALLHNMGVPGIVVSPDSDEAPLPDDVKATKAYVDEEFSGDRRGKPLVLSGRTKVQQFGFDPKQLDLRALRHVSEERVCGAIGVPAILASFGAGLARSTFANYQEARQAGYEECIITAHRLVDEDLWHQLLPDLDPQYASRTVERDYSRVRVLQDDRVKEAERLAILAGASLITRGEAREEAGYEAGAADDVYLMPLARLAVPADELPAPAAEAAPAALPLGPPDEA